MFRHSRDVAVAGSSFLRLARVSRCKKNEAVRVLDEGERHAASRSVHYSEESHQPSVSGPNRAKTSIEGQP